MAATHTPIPRGNLFVTGPPVPPTQKSPCAITPAMLPVITPSLIERNQLLVSNGGDSSNACCGVPAPNSPDPEECLYPCIASAVPDWTEGDTLRYTIQPGEPATGRRGNYVGKKMCLLCQWHYCDIGLPRCHITPFNEPDGFRSATPDGISLVQPSAGVLAGLPIVRLELSCLSWYTREDGQRAVNYSSLVWTPRSNKHVMYTEGEYNARRIAEKYGIRPANQRLGVATVERIKAAIAHLCVYLGSSVASWLLTDVVSSSGQAVPADAPLSPHLPWTPSSSRPLQQLLARRVSYMDTLVQVLRSNVESDGASSLDRYIYCIATQYLDALILMSIGVLRDPSIGTGVDLSGRPDMNIFTQPIAHEQTNSLAINILHGVSKLPNFFRIIGNILPMARKIGHIHTCLIAILNDLAGADAAAMLLAIRTTLLWNTSMHPDDPIKMPPVSLRMRHVVLGTSLLGLMRILGWRPTDPCKHALPLEMVLRIFWLRLLAMPKAGAREGIVLANSFFPPCVEMSADPLADLVYQCKQLALLRQTIDAWCQQQQQLDDLPFGYFSRVDLVPDDLPDADGQPPLLPATDTVRCDGKKSSRAPTATAAAATSASASEGAAAGATRNLQRRGVSQSIQTVRSVFTAMCMQGMRPSQHRDPATRAAATASAAAHAASIAEIVNKALAVLTRREQEQPAMKFFGHIKIQAMLQNMPSEQISLAQLAQLDISTETLECFAAMIDGHEDEPLTIAMLDHVCKTVYQRCGESGSRDIARMMIYVLELCHTQPIRVLPMHPSVRERQLNVHRSVYRYPIAGTSIVPICPKCCAVVAAPSHTPAAETANKTARVTTGRGRPSNVAPTKRAAPADFDAADLLRGNIRRQCLQCCTHLGERPGTFFNGLGNFAAQARLLHNPHAECDISLCIQCLDVTTVEDQRRRWLGVACVSCNTTMGRVVPRCIYMSSVSHPTSWPKIYVCRPMLDQGSGQFVPSIMCTTCFDSGRSFFI